MKKSSRIISGILVLCSLAGLTGCAAVSDGARTVNGETSEEMTRMQTVYQAAYHCLSREAPYALELKAVCEEGFYAVSYSMEAGETESPDREEEQTAFTEEADTEVSEEERGATDGAAEAVLPGAKEENYTASLYFIPRSGGLKKLENYRPASIPQELSAMPHFYASHEIMGLSVEQDGILLAVESVYMSWYRGPEGKRQNYGASYDAGKRSIFIRQLDSTGAELSCTELLTDEANLSYLQQPGWTAQEELIFTQGNQLYFYSQDGTEKAAMALEGMIRAVLSDEKGRLAALCYNSSGQQLLCRINRETMQAENILYLPDTADKIMLAPGRKYDALILQGTELKCCFAADQDTESILDWVEWGIDPRAIVFYTVAEEDTVQVLTISNDRENRKSTVELTELKKEMQEKPETVLTLGTLVPDQNLVRAVVDFNRKQQACRIRLINYSADENLQGEYGRGRLMTELLSGKLPDILDLRGLNPVLLAAKGRLEDLNPWLAADKELAKEDIFPAMLRACSVGELLYALSPGFSVDTVLASSALTGELEGWRYEQLEQIRAQQPEGTELFETFTTAEDVLRAALQIGIEDYVNWSACQAELDHEWLSALLKFAKQFPVSFDWNGHDWSDADIVDYRLMRQKQMLLRATVYTVGEVRQQMLPFGGDASYIGFPTHDGSVGNALRAEPGFAITVNCKNVDAAWKFIRSMLLYPAQQAYTGLPANRVVLQERLEQGMLSEYLVDESGEVIGNDAGDPIQRPKEHVGTAAGVRSLYAITPEQAQRLTELVESCEKIVCRDEALLEAAMEGALPFLRGECGLEAAVLQIGDAVEKYLRQYR